MNKKISKVQVLSLLSAGVIFFTTSCSVSKLSLKSIGKNAEYIDQKPYYQILKDSENFNVDMQVAYNYNSFYKLDKYIRLKMHDDKPVVVTCDKKFEDRDMGLSYLEELLAEEMKKRDKFKEEQMYLNGLGSKGSMTEAEFLEREQIITESYKSKIE